NGVIHYLNREARRVLGVHGDRVDDGRGIPDVHPDWAARIVQEQGIPTAIRDGLWRGEAAILTRDGREVPLDHVIVSHSSADGQPAFISMIGRDIAERKRAEDALRAATEQLRIVTDTMSAAVTRCSRDLRYLWVSRPYTDWIGRPQEDIIG